MCEFSIYTVILVGSWTIFRQSILERTVCCEAGILHAGHNGRLICTHRYTGELAIHQGTPPLAVSSTPLDGQFSAGPSYLRTIPFVRDDTFKMLLRLSQLFRT